ncbi:MAG: phosphoribosylanthranilate isomerase [Bacteroidetes bacterium]|nr:phosphoribosylanthranilate isomerase [Bacteroidota bacterium]MDA1120268.1 phosphoribosylanthranilate isomerase [Bacteroidota bacterium]
MALKTIVKVGEITNLSDARYCAGMGVEMLGFNLDPNSESYISPEQFKEITDWVAGVKSVGEFGWMNQDDILSTIKEYNLDLIEVNDSNAEIIFKTDIQVILSVNNIGIIKSLPDSAAYYLVEDVGFDFNDFDSLPILVGGGISKQNIHKILQNTAFKGIALKGSKEEKSGFKDYDELADILEMLEKEE